MSRKLYCVAPIAQMKICDDFLTAGNFNPEMSKSALESFCEK